ncbi:MAG: GTPase [Methylococcales bacterium]|nr:GTPase [Methylococcales bacterium]
MLKFIQHLRERYQALEAHGQSTIPEEVYQARINQQILAEAYLKRLVVWPDDSARPLQIAVVGPTQVGKSTVVNLLLQQTIAVVSPLAGYTVHAQAVLHQVTEPECAGFAQYFGRFQQLPLAALNPGRLDAYGLGISTANSPILPACVLWDTPDFDSINSVAYQEGLLRTLALADVLVLVVSKEKYADLSVWRMLELLAPLQQPTLICLNKLKPDMEKALLPDIASRWHALHGHQPDAVLPLYYDIQHSPEWPQDHADSLMRLARKARGKTPEHHAAKLIQRHWDDWVAPVRAEIKVREHWQALIDTAIEHAMSDYQQRFLNRPDHYETFQSAIATLLVLIEVPGFATWVANTRRVLTWPMRRLFGSFGKHRQTTQELPLLAQLGEHLLMELNDCLLERQEQQPHHGWQALASRLRQQRTALNNAFQDEAVQYHAEFQSEIDQAARQLHQHLQQHPMLLNGLRATRLTTDAAALALTFHAGGIGLHDLLLAPAMLSITSYLTESILGSRVYSIEANLKRKQRETVEQRLFGMLREQLGQLPDAFPDTAFFNLTAAQLSDAQAHLPSKKHGLRIL